MNLNENKEKIYQMICDDLYVPMKIKEMAILLQLPKERRGELEFILDQLIQEGKIQITKREDIKRPSPSSIQGLLFPTPEGLDS